jgi:hypothetical protein
MAAPQPKEMFGTEDPVQIASRFDDYKESLNKAFGSPIPFSPDGGPMTGENQSGLAMLQKSLASADLAKAVGADTVESIRAQLVQSEIGKDLTLTSPISTGLVLFDLEAPSKKLFPTETKVRNRIPRKKGVGTSHRFKVISGISGSDTGGVANVYPGITDSTTTTFGSINYLRGPKISYAGYDVAVPLSQFSLSDQVPWSAEFSGQGFEDLRQLSQTSVLWSSMLMEEKIDLMGRGTGSGFLGALAAPTGVTATARAVAGTEVAITGATTNIYAKVTADAGAFGQSVLSAAANVAVGSGVVDITVPSVPAGATGIRVYVGTGASLPADSALWYAGKVSGNVFTIQGALPTSGTAASTVSADTSAYAAGYDGIVPVCLGPNSGYVDRINSALSTANPGTEFFKAFDVMYQQNGADPDEIMLNGSDRRQLSDLLKTSTSSNYKLQISNENGAHSAQIGALIVGLQNEVTGKMVDLSINRYMPQGVAPIISWTLPLSGSNVSDVWEKRLVQDYMGIQWPVTQHAYECGSYWYGAMYCVAPQWNGAIAGIRLT